MIVRSGNWRVVAEVSAPLVRIMKGPLLGTAAIKPIPSSGLTLAPDAIIGHSSGRNRDDMHSSGLGVMGPARAVTNTTTASE